MDIVKTVNVSIHVNNVQCGDRIKRRMGIAVIYRKVWCETVLWAQGTAATFRIRIVCSLEHSMKLLEVELISETRLNKWCKIREYPSCCTFPIIAVLYAYA